ncbi:MAG: metal-dependent transcriptional regulator [Clostridia bacterium]|nr:metal-dependent transcriptional regulator [Clostridia bacterium]
MKKLTYTMENYLEAIYELSQADGARVSDIAERMGVTKASTHRAMTALAEKGLVIHEKYKKILLTPKGYSLAQLTAEKHHVIQEFLTMVLMVSPDISESDACAIEHVISSETIAAMKIFMDKNRISSHTES